MDARRAGVVADLLREPPEVIGQLQDSRLARMLALCARGHAHYRRRWAEAGIDIGTIRTLTDLATLPLTSKAELMADPESFRLHVPDLPLHERALWEVNYTTGSTGDPTPIYITTHDYQAYMFQSRRVAEISGFGESDVIANLFPFTPAPMGAFVRSAANAYAVGATIAGALTGAPFGEYRVHRALDEAVRMVERHRATILWGVTSFVRRVVMRAAELGADFTSVRMCAISGEASGPAMREDLRARLRALGARHPVVFDRYGSTEAGAFAQCQEEGDWHNPTPELLALEVVDPETGAPLPDGARGALALTHLDRRGTVLLRYLVGDVVSLAHGPCPHCGRAGGRIQGPVVRTKDLVKVKGMLVNPSVLLETLRRVPGVEEFQVVLGRQDPADPLSMDEMVVRVATRRPDRPVLAERLIGAVAAAVGVRPRIEFAPADDIYDPTRQSKAERLVDRR
jgi:phenylacetate-coenzyme A ligase PaaK-like adenylate-forming protein